MQRKTHYLLLFVLFLLTTGMVAQSKTVTGTVTDESGMPLLGVNVLEKGTSNGTSTDFDGKYTITVADESSVLEFTSIGYTLKTSFVTGKTTVNVTMAEDAEQLGEVVVTALGIKKEAKALGYSLTEVGGDELSNVKQVSAINSLQGKVAGVNITQNSTGAAGSSRVIIRGNSTLTGNNQPLYVVDGIPIGNDNNGSSGTYGGSDGGDGISSINPDDIATVSVLKGGAAAALYGSRAGNGVIIITTKNGSQKKGLGVEISSSVTFDEVDTSLTDFQTTYGQGTRGRVPSNQSEAFDLGLSSWGPKLDGSSVVQWDGVERPYSYAGDNREHFYRTGTTFINTIAITSGSENMSYRLSVSDLDNEDIVPNSGINRKSFSLNTSAVLADKLTSQVNVKYIVENATNRPRLSDAPGNANYSVALLSPNIDVRDMNPGANPDGSERGYSANIYSQNPYYAAYNFSNEDSKNRIIASTSLRYEILDWLYASTRVGVDHYTRKATNVEPWGTAYKVLGGMTETEGRYTQIDADVMLGVNKAITDKFTIDGLLGANSNHIKTENLYLGGDNFVVPGFEDISNLRDQSRSRDYQERKISGIYGSLGFAYDKWAYLTFTGRNDWFSTLSYPGKTTPNNEFYFSVNSSIILSDVLELPSFIDFLKIRGGYSGVAGGGDSAYQLSPTYQIFGQGHQGQTLGRINGSSVPNADLVPWEKDETEIGLDLRLFGSRLSLDVAYYQNETTKDIVNISTSVFSGYDSATANIGSLENKGIEFLISGTPIKTEDFSWNTSFNGAYNKSEVTATNDDGNPISLDEPRTQNARITHIVGEPYGSIVGVSYNRDDTGNIIYDIDSDGVPIAQEGERKILGEGVPPLTLGWSNTFRYKDFNLGFLIDGKFGGQILSGTNALGYSTGLHKTTLEGRENGLEVSGIDGDTALPFTTTVAPEDLQTYYGRVSRIAEEFVEDSDYIKFRELSIGYTLPEAMLEKTFINSVSVSLIARNLFYISRSIDNVDPESTYNVGNSQGLEYFGVPSTRNYGFSLNVKF
ncbi:SusC/RagA family TonB-linked outer membrane protein [Cellulophaga sp. 20_2_10]|uniref:SusC/RagA family TonB-linked outer membrane protein n=1 Tax=Cellulophaga sp. 20_2_10 TaxID=2942476 RepID=UPI00201AABA5|nr:SusC/RagA family TonB-linked outer membrane protein [Cellulophaga sp. 20_2_10]MCL5245292.1 SusC/RagA family TonB-linked outer membrane protein [Cellulophaga sp. 20_2_10]